jgi:putative ABC transport system substrate-binding protein
VRPDILPILRQEQPTVLVDPERLQALKVSLPAAMLEKKTEVRDGFWQLGVLN